MCRVSFLLLQCFTLSKCSSYSDETPHDETPAEVDTNFPTPDQAAARNHADAFDKFSKRFQAAARLQKRSVKFIERVNILDVVSRTAADGMIYVLVANHQWRDIVKNWICGAKKLGIRNIVLLATDQMITATNMLGVPIIHLNVPERARDRKWKKTFTYHEALWYARSEIVQLVLQAGVSVAHVDADAPFVSDPTSIYNQPGDVIFSRDVPDWQWLLCMGWAFFRATRASVSLIERMRSVMGKGIPGSPVYFRHDDQVAMNYVVRNHYNLRWNTTATPLDPSTWDTFLSGTAAAHGTELSVTLVPNTVIWRLNCEPGRRSDTQIAVHCRNVRQTDKQEVFVTQDKKASDKADALIRMGGWHLSADCTCEHGVSRSSKSHKTKKIDGCSWRVGTK